MIGMVSTHRKAGEKLAFNDWLENFIIYKIGTTLTFMYRYTIEKL